MKDELIAIELLAIFLILFSDMKVRTHSCGRKLHVHVQETAAKLVFSKPTKMKVVSKVVFSFDLH